MNYTIIKKLPSTEELIQRFPLSMAAHKKILQDRAEINAILEGKDDRLLMIVGPCSAWPTQAVIEYAEKLLVLSKKVAHALKIVMRVYIQKPRTTKGWTGPINQPDPSKPPDIEAGMQYTRAMMVKILEMGLPIADEALFTHNARGFIELLSWVAVGARSAEDQEHRIFASAANCAVGMKNPTHGSLTIAVNSVIAAQHPHVIALDGYEIATHGNPHAHVVLRGADHLPNYSIPHLETLEKHLKGHHIKNPSVIIDVSHDNCLIDGKKHPEKQPKIIFEILNSVKNRPELKQLLKGFMVESFLKAGNQTVDEAHPEKIDMSGLSITDPCLSFAETEKMLFALTEKMKV